jgi:DivIVA domain-containing protein
MSPTELDLPLLPSAEQIRRREFATIRRGYDPDQVRDYLQQIATQVETLEAALREARLELASADRVVTVTEPEPQEDPYEKLAKRIAELIRAADTEADRIVTDAKAEATRSVSEARSDADRIRVDAQARAEEARQSGNEVLENARIEAERVLSGLSARRETLVTQLQAMQEKLLGVAADLENAIDEHDERTAGPARTGSERRGPHGSSDPVDPRYEDLWTSADASPLNLEDLGSIDLGFDDGAE